MSSNDFALVIVDVPSLQTNIPYTYRIPEEMQGLVDIGMRVSVPFGLGDRLVQGFVVDLSRENKYSGEVKSIEAVLDLKPVLSSELIACGQWMAESTFSFIILCLQAMLPSALRASYDKYISLTDKGQAEMDISLQRKYFGATNSCSWSDIKEKHLFGYIKSWQSRGWVEMKYVVRDKVTHKKQQMIFPTLTSDEYQKLYEQRPANAKRQKQLLALLKDLTEPMLVTELTKTYEIPRSTIDVAQKSGWARVKSVEIYRNPYAHRDVEKSSPLPLTSEQQVAFDAITQSIGADEYQTYLLQGVTGSGKTEIYMQTIARALTQKKGAIVLVPEIALTPQMVYRFKSRFGDQVAVMHSGLSEGERFDEWRRIKEGQAQIVVGARSSIFAPLENIGVIIIDEEHETTYKQEEMPRYHARDVAQWRAKRHKCPVVLGSATPSLESRARAEKGVYRLLKLSKRATAHQLPTIEIEDMRDDIAKGNRSSISLKLKKAMEDRLDQDEQIVLLLNRRGFSSFLLCRDCGFVLKCPNCDISQTLHMDTKTMRCHYCGHEENIPQVCPQCHSQAIRYYGVGIQKVEQELYELFPQARILRMDIDTTRKKDAYEQILTQFKEHQADILLGTQMIAKGLDFPDVTLVGVVNADTALGLPDFRSAEKTFQLLTQVSGRAGRGDKSGEVIIQTFNPEHYAIQFASQQDYDRFFYYEMQKRHQNNYSPYYYLIKIQVSHEKEMIAAQEIQAIYHQLAPSISKEAIVLGPSANSIARTHNQYHYQMIIKYKNEPRLNQRLYDLAEQAQKKTQNKLYIRIDPEPNYFL